MRKPRLQRLFSWPPSAKFCCLSVFIFCGLLTAFPIAYVWDIFAWEQPSIETRERVNADLSSCILRESELPDGWTKDSPLYFPIKGPEYPVTTGMLGGALTLFAYDKSDSNKMLSQELKYYDKTHRAVRRYKLRPVGSSSTRYRKWKPLELSHANLSANAYKARCFNHMSGDGRVHEIQTCEIKARYGRFVSILETKISNQGISMEKYIQVLQAIDRQLLQCVDSFADKTWAEE